MGPVPRDGSGRRRAAALRPPGVRPPPRTDFTPTTKAETGHDLPLTPDDAIELVGRGLFERLKELTLTLYERLARLRGSGASSSRTRSSSSASRPELILIDEVGTPDSSRFWPADAYEPGGPQRSYDKQFVRDHLDASGWDREPPPPSLPADVIAGTSGRYREAFERDRGRTVRRLSGARRRCPGADDDAALDRLRGERA